MFVILNEKLSFVCIYKRYQIKLKILTFPYIILYKKGKENFYVF